ncbi:unnamed protein product, partial [Didymodactylos carnosus]
QGKTTAKKRRSSSQRHPLAVRSALWSSVMAKMISLKNPAYCSITVRNIIAIWLGGFLNAPQPNADKMRQS